MTNSTEEYIRPSQLQQAAACPGSYRMQQGIKDTPSPEAAEGTMLHERVVSGYLGGLDMEQSDAVRRCIEFRDSLRTGYDTMRSEKSLELRDTQGNLLTKGTCDVLLTDTMCNKCAIIDWKFGRTPVADCAGNYQLAAYALGAMELTGAPECEAHIYQPRIGAHTQYTFRQPAPIIRNLSHIMARAMRGDKLELNPGEEQCRYCKAKSECPAFRRMASAVAAVAQDSAALSDPATLAKWYGNALAVRKYCDQVEAAMKAYLDQHGECGPYRWKETAGRREVDDISHAFFALSDILTQSQFLDCCTVAVGRLEDAVARRLQAQAEAKGGKLTEREAKTQFAALMDGILRNGTPTRKIVRSKEN